jgi:hypothetical protein
MPAIRHRALAIDGLNVFVREAGLPGNPAVVLLLVTPRAPVPTSRASGQCGCAVRVVGRP